MSHGQITESTQNLDSCFCIFMSSSQVYFLFPKPPIIRLPRHSQTQSLHFVRALVFSPKFWRDRHCWPTSCVSSRLTNPLHGFCEPSTSHSQTIRHFTVLCRASWTSGLFRKADALYNHDNLGSFFQKWIIQMGSTQVEGSDNTNAFGGHQMHHE